MLGDPAARGAADEEPALRRVVDAECKPLVGLGGRARDEAGQRGLEDLMKPMKKSVTRKATSQTECIRKEKSTKTTARRSTFMRRSEATLRLRSPDDGLHHDGEADEHGRKIDVPVVQDGKSHLDELRRNDDEEGHLRSAGRRCPR